MCLSMFWHDFNTLKAIKSYSCRPISQGPIIKIKPYFLMVAFEQKTCIR